MPISAKDPAKIPLVHTSSRAYTDVALIYPLIHRIIHHKDVAATSTPYYCSLIHTYIGPTLSNPVEPSASLLPLLCKTWIDNLIPVSLCTCALQTQDTGADVDNVMNAVPCMVEDTCGDSHMVLYTWS